MIDYQTLYPALQAHGLGAWAEQLSEQQRLDPVFGQRAHGELERWRSVIDQLPTLEPGTVALNRPRVSVAGTRPLTPAETETIRGLLMQLHPWRKGPYQIHGLHIDTEWRSDWKWDRVAPHISPLAGRNVLDIGCGNGYHCWRMAGEGAGLVIGIDPTQLFLAQFLAIRHFLTPDGFGPGRAVHLLPLGIEQLPPDLRAFDSVFSMGVLYHRRSPIDHLYELRAALRPGGELILETLVIEGGAGQVLVPAGRYAKMRNVWFIPTPTTLTGWLERCGFRNVKVVDVTPTTTGEQRATDWMRFESLADYLDPADPAHTIEGHPAPTRAVLVATAP